MNKSSEQTTTPDAIIQRELALTASQDILRTLGLTGADQDTNRYRSWGLLWRLAEIGRKTTYKDVQMSQRKSKTVLLLREIYARLKNDPFSTPEDSDFILYPDDVRKAYSIVQELEEILKNIDSDEIYSKVETKIDRKQEANKFAQITDKPEIIREPSEGAKLMRYRR